MLARALALPCASRDLSLALQHCRGHSPNLEYLWGGELLLAQHAQARRDPKNSELAAKVVISRQCIPVRHPARVRSAPDVCMPAVALCRADATARAAQAYNEYLRQTRTDRERESRASEDRLASIIDMAFELVAPFGELRPESTAPFVRPAAPGWPGRQR